MNQEGTSKKKRFQAGAGIAVVGVVVVGAAIATTSKHSGADGSTVSSSGTANTTSVSTDPNATYKNGTYSATGKYDSPGGQESIKVSLTLDNNVVTATNATEEANDTTAVSYQDLFINGYKSQVVGKKISSINLTNVSGSSLTSQGFNNALQQIEKQAKS